MKQIKQIKQIKKRRQKIFESEKNTTKLEQHQTIGERGAEKLEGSSQPVWPLFPDGRGMETEVYGFLLWEKDTSLNL